MLNKAVTVRAEMMVYRCHLSRRSLSKKKPIDNFANITVGMLKTILSACRKPRDSMKYLLEQLTKED